MKMKIVLTAFATLGIAACSVNPDADKSFGEGRRRIDSMENAARSVAPVTPDTGQHAMPVAPIAPGDMPVVNPADTARTVPR